MSKDHSADTRNKVSKDQTIKDMSEVPLPNGAEYYPPEHIQQASELPDQTPHIDLDEILKKLTGNDYTEEHYAYMVRELDAYVTARVIDELESMRDQMYSMYHIIGATMNDKEAISSFDYEFEERINELRGKQ